MDIFQVFMDRRSIRKYMAIPVEADKIEQVLDAARLALSWKNQQCWLFLIVDDQKYKMRCSKPSPRRIQEPGRSRGALWSSWSVPIRRNRAWKTASNITSATPLSPSNLSVHALGLGTCWMGWYDDSTIRRALCIPDTIRFVGFTPLGYPDQEPKARPRRLLSKITFTDRWKSP